jgi:hypothetical protein
MGALAALPAMGQDPGSLEDVKAQLQKATQMLKEQQSAIEAMQKKIAEMEARSQVPAVAPPAQVSEEAVRKVAQEEVAKAKPNLGALDGIKVGGQIFFSYQNGESYSASSTSEDKTDAYSRFIVKRGYIDIQKAFTPWMKARITPEIYQDATGNYSSRMKYIYAGFYWKGNSFVNTPYLEAGLVRNPWFDFEESINIYRLQDNMFLERTGIIGTTEQGVLFGGDFGEPLPKSYQDQVSNKYPGRWGSFQLVISNGGGYNTPENNMNKALMGRVSFRPMPDILPGFQMTLFGVSGRGNLPPTRYTKVPFKNKEIYPSWSMWDGMLSYQHPHFSVTGQYYESRGNALGTRFYGASDYLPGEVDPADIFKPRSQKGYSFFADVKFPANRKWSWMGRMDYYDPDTKGILVLQNNRDVTRRYITGLSYRLFKDNIVLLDYDVLKHSRTYKPGTVIPDEGRVQLTIQMKF